MRNEAVQAGPDFCLTAMQNRDSTKCNKKKEVDNLSVGNEAWFRANQVLSFLFVLFIKRS